MLLASGIGGSSGGGRGGCRHASDCAGCANGRVRCGRSVGECALVLGWADSSLVAMAADELSTGAAERERESGSGISREEQASDGRTEAGGKRGHTNHRHPRSVGSCSAAPSPLRCSFHACLDVGSDLRAGAAALASPLLAARTPGPARGRWLRVPAAALSAGAHLARRSRQKLMLDERRESASPTWQERSRAQRKRDSAIRVRKTRRKQL